METWKLEELETIAHEIVDKAKEDGIGRGEGDFTHDAHNIYLECDYIEDSTDVVYYPDSGYYEGGDLCGLELYNIDGCWIDEEGNEFSLTDEEKQALQDAVNELIY